MSRNSLQLPCPSQYGKGVFLFKIKNPSTVGAVKGQLFKGGLPKRRPDNKYDQIVILLVLFYSLIKCFILCFCFIHSNFVINNKLIIPEGHDNIFYFLCL